jgi:hypothetical protein
MLEELGEFVGLEPGELLADDDEPPPTASFCGWIL